jgi:hypothetical protein
MAGALAWLVPVGCDGWTVRSAPLGPVVPKPALGIELFKVPEAPVGRTTSGWAPTTGAAAPAGRSKPGLGAAVGVEGVPIEAPGDDGVPTELPVFDGVPTELPVLEGVPTPPAPAVAPPVAPAEPAPPAVWLQAGTTAQAKSVQRMASFFM